VSRLTRAGVDPRAPATRSTGSPSRVSAAYAGRQAGGSGRGWAGSGCGRGRVAGSGRGNAGRLRGTAGLAGTGRGSAGRARGRDGLNGSGRGRAGSGRGSAGLAGSGCWSAGLAGSGRGSARSGRGNGGRQSPACTEARIGRSLGDAARVVDATTRQHRPIMAAAGNALVLRRKTPSLVVVSDPPGPEGVPPYRPAADVGSARPFYATGGYGKVSLRPNGVPALRLQAVTLERTIHQRRAAPPGAAERSPRVGTR
jgi:hypothetical protein